ncbi:MAG TPA: hypothetical protein VFI17_12435 [Solirubrobacterales bacterium]|nr:hypothetical protein [Solirubrobacterales bacterium]
MREQLNSNPLVQMGVIAVLLVAAAIFLFTSMGGGGSEEGGEGGSLNASAAPEGVGPAPSPGEAGAPGAAGAPATLATKPLPQSVVDAWNANQTVVLLFVHDGSVDDDLVKLATDSLRGMAGVTTFVVPAGDISHYVSITQGVGVDRVPALVVLRPKRLDESVPTASVSYGFQNSSSVIQAVVDAGYQGPTLEYHP